MDTVSRKARYRASTRPEPSRYSRRHPQYELAQKQMSGFGGVLSFELKGGYEAADQCLSRLRLASRAASMGGVETLAVHPAPTSCIT